MTNIAPTRQAELIIISALAAQYNGVCPVRIEVSEGEMLASHLQAKISVPGQSRVYAFKSSELSTPEGTEQVLEEVRFAVYLLLDEDAKDA